ncbi:hypothetical protein HQO38_16780 [Rhodococcus fascians]|uniref:hypothetical protein n=1 Tax=Rhodococcoides fascians TaxID=1828 RepID=UPI00195E29C6|nr:hypothetical protein [Rhodococcus fascians]MBM7242770.1 hypothetical protein [Rhodococcus fascians]MBY3809134.1 hypothetical protein [Rhodococcus fascians]MBY3840918.1 hypothetical protein [Rhodococcus fascians]MBY3846305.1 hypothetical protein [Rhodococcus fascians]MBY3851124.1 hypothetical protein [Rhodococcus fascians]
MRLSELLDIPVHDSDGRRIGWVIDVRFRATESRSGDEIEPPELVGLLINSKNRSTYLGYERRDLRSPRLIASIVRWRHRGTWLVSWSDVYSVEASRVTLRPGHRRHSPMLDVSAHT